LKNLESAVDKAALKREGDESVDVLLRVEKDWSSEGQKDSKNLGTKVL